jgi:hypothetical protein
MKSFLYLVAAIAVSIAVASTHILDDYLLHSYDCAYYNKADLNGPPIEGSERFVGRSSSMTSARSKYAILILEGDVKAVKTAMTAMKRPLSTHGKIDANQDVIQCKIKDRAWLKTLLSRNPL